MAEWAYPCRPPGDEQTVWHVSKAIVDEYPASVQMVEVKVGARWARAVLDRAAPVSVDRMLLRDVEPCDPEAGGQDS